MRQLLTCAYGGPTKDPDNYLMQMYQPNSYDTFLAIFSDRLRFTGGTVRTYTDSVPASFVGANVTPRQTALRVLAYTLISSSALLYLWDTIPGVIQSLPGPSDFAEYHSAARAITGGRSPFSVFGYLYPPLLAFLLVPLAHTEYLAARWIWFLLSQGCSILTAYILWKHLGRTLLSACLIAAAWAACGTVWGEALGLGQFTPFLLLLLTLAYVPSSALAGSALGTAAAIKLFPAILLPGLWIGRERRLVRWGVACFLALTLISVAALRAFWPPPYSPPNKTYVFGTPAVLNFSIAGITLRMLDKPTTSQMLPPAWQFGNILDNLELPKSHQYASAAVTLALLLAVYSVWAKTYQRLRNPSPQHRDLLIASLASLSLAASPVSWSHYQILSAPGAVVIVHYALRVGRLPGAVVAAIALFLTYRVPYAVLQQYAASYPWPSAGEYPEIWYVGTSISCLASLGLAFLAWQVAAQIMDCTVGPSEATQSGPPA